MQSKEKDTPQPPTVAPTTAKTSPNKKEAKNISLTINTGHTTPTDNRHEPLDPESITDAEMFAIRALRDWTRAGKDAAHRHNLEAWELIRDEVSNFYSNGWTLEAARQVVGNESALSYFLLVKEAAMLHEWFASKLYKRGGMTVSESVEAYADFDAWQLLYLETSKVLEGKTPPPLDVEADPELYTLCAGIKAWIEERRVLFIQDNTEHSSQEGGEANG